ncbi:radical SAM protein [Vallitalea okinawensis]|uniref:radical SAM protein n=1 Tax=Vallitalea okinawensis TaxID=2078660 RepID=UPI000CFBA6E5|nr:radical SAM protein [Vallitalea okinawensis]
MKINHFISLSWFGVKTILMRQKKAILGTIILTDQCNLNCQHCAVGNINKKIYSYEHIKEDMESLYSEGIRILFFCGGETLLWQDGNKNIRHLVQEAKAMGFYIVNVVTNGTINLNIPEADLIFLSIDGNKQTHDLIRGETFDTIIKNLDKANDSNICIYMAVNKMNYNEIGEVGELAKQHPHIKAISFNFHTPYEGTEHLRLNYQEKQLVVSKIKKMMKSNIPVFNLYSALDTYMKNKWKRPCYQCIVIEDRKKYICGRCVEIEGLCDECGYLFAVEFSLLFSGNIRIIWEMLWTYCKYI